ncbi:hypothetical protein P7K49_026212 [Saguinus oedipus]|uniref:Uncharacterized protein n=1 Tax=Saguinus oedipus TaxID=9490 RepID=A0ABQ9UCM6_SAGOE|nr:hypothetical protein P7K49_026212 [Saguinus oedipus]
MAGTRQSEAEEKPGYAANTVQSLSSSSSVLKVLQETAGMEMSTRAKILAEGGNDAYTKSSAIAGNLGNEGIRMLKIKRVSANEGLFQASSLGNSLAIKTNRSIGAPGANGHILHWSSTFLKPFPPAGSCIWHLGGAEIISQHVAPHRKTEAEHEKRSCHRGAVPPPTAIEQRAQ